MTCRPSVPSSSVVPQCAAVSISYRTYQHPAAMPCEMGAYHRLAVVVHSRYLWYRQPVPRRTVWLSRTVEKPILTRTRPQASVGWRAIQYMQV